MGWISSFRGYDPDLRRVFLRCRDLDVQELVLVGLFHIDLIFGGIDSHRLHLCQLHSGSQRRTGIDGRVLPVQLDDDGVLSVVLQCL